MKKVTEWLAALGGAIASFFTGLPPIIWVLLAVMTVDYVTGIICGFMGKSPKTQHGGLSSSEAFKGLLKKALILLVVLLAALLDKAVSMGTGITFEAVAGATALWFIASEGFSILENAAHMGIPIPKVLLQALEIVRQKGGSDGKKDKDTFAVVELPTETPVDRLVIGTKDQQVTLPAGITREKLDRQIDEVIQGDRAARDRALLRAYLYGDYTFDTLAECFDVSTDVVRDVVDRGRGKIYA